MKKSKQKSKKAIFILSFAMSVFVLTAQSDARMIITNPGENASSEMRISWHTDLGVENSFVEYTKRADTNWENSRKVVGSYSLSTVWNGIPSRICLVQGEFIQDIQVYHYKAVLSNLKSGTDYMYRVWINNVASDPRFFKTAGTGEFTFAWISDFHVYCPLPRRLNDAMNMTSTLIEASENGIDFIFSTGDDVAHGGSYTQWLSLFDHEHTKNYMWVRTIGNHETYSRGLTHNKEEYYTHTHNNPPNGFHGQEGASFWFMYNNVLWIILNCQDMHLNPAQIPIAQAWVAEVIRNNPAQYIFVAQHRQWFMGETGAYAGAGFARWHEFFDKWGVDLALAGNNHIYVRTYPVYNQQVSTEKGTVYIQISSSDGDRGQEMNETLTYNAEKIAFRWTEGGATIGGMLITVNENEIHVRLYDRHGNRLDEAKIPARRAPMKRF